MKFFQRGLAVLLLVIAGACSSSRPALTQRDLARGGPAVPEVPGARSDGSVLLPNQWSLRPAGKQIPVGDFPINIAMHSGGRFAAVLHSGSNGGRNNGSQGSGFDDASSWFNRIASALPLLALLVGLAAISSMTDNDAAREVAEIDLQLLTDELPPAAHTDPGFAQFLKFGPPNP